MLAFGVVCIASGEAFSMWFPINKKLWTSSYVLLTAGLALVCLALCYAVVDIKKWHRGWSLPFVVFGMNAIAAYVFSELLSIGLSAMHIGDLTWQEFLYQSLFAPLASPFNASLLFAISFVLVCWVAMLLLNRKRIYVKI
jgi:predicted acyltransferase